MAIKINGLDLQARKIDWQDVEKVYLNWAVIRPYEQAPVEYHVIGDITCESDSCMGGNWWSTSWWWWYWGWWDWWAYSEGWGDVYRWRWLPNLRPAKRIEIVEKVTWNWTHLVNEDAFWWDLTRALEDWVGSKVRWKDWPNVWLAWLQLETWLASWDELSNITFPWTYTLFWVIDMVNEYMTLEVKNWNVVISTATFYLNATSIRYIRWCNYFRFMVWEWAKMSKVDFYVYYQRPVPSN